MVRAPAGRWFVLRARVLALKSRTIYNFIVIIITIILYRSRSVCARVRLPSARRQNSLFFVSLPSPRSVLPRCSSSIAPLWRKYDAVGRSVRPTVVVNPSENPNFHPVFGDVERVCRNSILLQYCFPSAERPLHSGTYRSRVGDAAAELRYPSGCDRCNCYGCAWSENSSRGRGRRLSLPSDAGQWPRTGPDGRRGSSSNSRRGQEDFAGERRRFGRGKRNPGGEPLRTVAEKT